MTLILNGTDNSATTPAVTGTDTDTGIYYPAANQIAIATNGTQAMLVDSSQNVTFAQAANLPNTFGFKNRIINGAMVIDQRNAGASVSTSGYAVDRTSFALGISTGSTGQQSSTAPAGFNTSLKITIGTGGTVVAGTVCRVYQVIEGFNVADLGWGSANASTITISFWVNCSVAGTFAGGLYNASANRTYVFTYSVNATNTWEQKTITIVGDTSGTWAKDNTAGIYVNWDLGSGSTYQATAGSWGAGAAWATSGSVKLATTTGATFYITGVQLEKGSTATSFDYRSIGTEFMLCLRYYEILNSNYSFPVFVPNGGYLNKVAGTWTYQVQKRTTPSLSQISGSTVGGDRFGIGPATISTVGLNASNDTMMTFDITLSASYTTGERMALTGNKIYQASAEL